MTMRLFIIASLTMQSLALQAPRRPAALQPKGRGATAVTAIAPTGVWIAGSVAGGCLGTPLVIKATKTWYSDGSLKLPSWTPNKGIFAPTWTLLYATIGLAGRRAAVAGALPRLAVAHYLLNLCWAPLFFGLKQIRASAALNVVLLASLWKCAPAFKAVNSWRLLAPYACWLSFATLLNFEIARLNPRGVSRGLSGGTELLY